MTFRQQSNNRTFDRQWKLRRFHTLQGGHFQRKTRIILTAKLTSVNLMSDITLAYLDGGRDLLYHGLIIMPPRRSGSLIFWDATSLVLIKCMSYSLDNHLRGGPMHAIKFADEPCAAILMTQTFFAFQSVFTVYSPESRMLVQYHGSRVVLGSAPDGMLVCLENWGDLFDTRIVRTSVYEEESRQRRNWRKARQARPIGGTETQKRRN